MSNKLLCKITHKATTCSLYKSVYYELRRRLMNVFFPYFFQVAKASFQKSNDPLDAAIFYLALKKKAVVWGLYR